MLAMIAGLAEYAVEAILVPATKQQWQWVSYLGLVLVLAGEVIRKTAMVTAASSFTHDIARERRDKHVLVTTGIYRYVRHPGYLGWFLWSIATQLLLVNPVCTVGFTYVVSASGTCSTTRYLDWHQQGTYQRGHHQLSGSHLAFV
eukprot:GHUV01022848.1.p2 GENE.GHUV01022848.1~~GHUV01022848.1.p2  ORF type:complete len:145 (+),score=25.53 GHUV01022848.1:146-580(+)